MDRFADAKVGDKVYDRVYGFGKVKATHPYSNKDQLPLKIDFHKHIGTHSYSSCGKSYLHAEEATLFYVDGGNKYAEKRPIPKVPWDKVPVDTKIIVGGDMKRYYAGFKHFYPVGLTSWTNGIPVEKFGSHIVVLAEEITIDGVVYPIGSK